MKDKIVIIDSNENGSLAFVHNDTKNKYGITVNFTFIPCKSKVVANKVYSLIKEE